MFKAVMFDLDGTLVDTLDDLMYSMNAMLADFSYPERSREEIRSFLGYGQKVFVTQSLPEYARDEENIKKCSACYDKFYTENNERFSMPYDGIPEILRSLKLYGIYTVMLTNKDHIHALRIAQALFEKSDFDIVLGAGEFKRKPDPESTLFVAEKLGVIPSECAFVGDSEVDIETAKNAGMYSVGVTWGFRGRKVLEDAGADEIVDNTAELAKILKVK